MDDPFGTANTRRQGTSCRTWFSFNGTGNMELISTNAEAPVLDDRDPVYVFPSLQSCVYGINPADIDAGDVCTRERVW